MDFHLELFTELDRLFLELGAPGKLLLAALLGSLIGIEREYKGKTAGIKTNMLITVGSCLIMIISREVGGGAWDPARIAAQVVSGIGFLGAGTIIQSRHFIKGLTTAATLWLLAGVGLAVGADYAVVATGATLLVLLVLILMGPIESFISRVGYKTCIVEVELHMSSKSIGEVEALINQYKIHEHGFRVERKADGIKFSFSYSAPAKEIKDFQGRLLGLQDISRVDVQVEG